MRVLSLSGGGFQGLFSALCLNHLEQETGQPLNKMFDMFAGTSVGAITATAGAVGMPMSKVVDIFEKQGVKIFSGRPAPVTSTAIARDFMRYVNKAKYDGGELNRVISAYCGGMKMGDLDTPLLITAVRLHDGEPVVFTRETHPDVLISDAVMASAAAPMMFPPVMVNGSLHADGGLFANCPDHLALAYAKGGLGADVSDVRMLSVGAMNKCPPLTEPTSPNMGVMGWLSENRIFRTIISSQAIMAESMVRAEIGQNYMRVDACSEGPGRAHVGLDVADEKSVKAIQIAAESCYDEIMSCEHLICHESDELTSGKG